MPNLLVGQLEEVLLGLLNVLAVAANRDLGRDLLLGEVDGHAAALLDNVLQHLALGADNGVVELGVDVNGVRDNVGLLGLDLEDAVAGCLAVLLSACKHSRLVHRMP